MEFDSEHPIEHELREMQQDAPYLVLHANGAPSICPFMAPIPVLNPNGTWEHQRTCCNTGCPLTEIRYRDTKATGEPPELDAGPEKRKPAALGLVKAVFALYCGSSTKSLPVTIRRISVIQPAGNGIIHPIR